MSKRGLMLALAVLLAAPLIGGATCLRRVGDECQTDRDCANDEVCNDGGCEAIGGEGEGEGEQLCEGCCFDAATDCRASEVCRFSQAAIDSGDPGACVDSDGIPYRLGLLDVRICERMLDGSEWDVGAGAPDPFMRVEVNGVSTSTAAVQDVFNAGDFVLELELRSTDVVNLYLVDEDLTENDAITSYCVANECGQAIGVDRLRLMNGPVGDAGCATDAIAAATFVLVPAPN